MKQQNLGTYYAVRLAADKNPARGTVIAEAPATGHGIPESILALWKPAEICVVWSRPLEPPRQLPEESLARVRQKRLRRRLEKDVPLFADELKQKEHAKRPEFFAGKRDETPKP
jgi:hypothetical protein